ncbi:MAG: hypothetical protein SGBAC_013152, partial [Bacillariaceae sp.]
MAYSAIILLVLLEPFFFVAAFQQTPVLFSYRQDRAFCPRITSIWSAADIASATADIIAEEKKQVADYDWDEQFEILLLFKKEYGHCNFPPNAPTELSEKYPTLARFCQDQRQEWRNFQNYGSRMTMSLSKFDRSVRYRRLEEIGFEFLKTHAKWYDKFYELLEYQKEHGHFQVRAKENFPLYRFVCYQRARRKGSDRCSALSESQIKLLDGIGFEWEPNFFFCVVWMAKYNELVDFKEKHGHFWVPGDPSQMSLNRWIRTQRRRRVEKSDNPLSEEQIKLLDDIDFPWIPDQYIT